MAASRAVSEAIVAAGGDHFSSGVTNPIVASWSPVE
jgi:hypothetical protein